MTNCVSVTQIRASQSGTEPAMPNIVTVYHTHNYTEEEEKGKTINQITCESYVVVIEGSCPRQRSQLCLKRLKEDFLDLKQNIALIDI